ncbi:uncharacterized protein K452DRAFT_301779 [Aplosporella prunicola CBS 121167]|uniref:Natural resistance-associated macrophage protein n=1 Tax=Aplosporella prunicola CBS 121167 TaxID=1176127 RepID=A0A6A6B071_9PEZI|nr:uncharacterized protein K452DRAFT_301779 [Aplosporella prunicola CBS 121167]KAF2137582.1 hypothetical protein K452DRAFT_301779 [Aplosporella prunicola CBS 121167]
MNCPSRVEPDIPLDWNQNPDHLNADSTTRNDLNHIANERRQRKNKARVNDDQSNDLAQRAPANEDEIMSIPQRRSGDSGDANSHETESKKGMTVGIDESPNGSKQNLSLMQRARGYSVNSIDWSVKKGDIAAGCKSSILKTKEVIYKYAKFVGPGFMVAVAYVDPGNYSTDVAAGASYRFKLLFIILMSNIFAIFLQSLCVKLGSVTGMNLAESCREFLPKWLNIILYVFAEAAIIATDIAEVIGFAIALNVLGNVPLVAGCAISIVDVMIILFFYRPNGSMRVYRYFEYFVMLLVVGVVVCFCYQLSLLENTSVGDVFRGYLPSGAVVESDGLYQSCGILGATVMPHSLYLGSGIIQPRLREYDENAAAENAANNATAPEPQSDADSDTESVNSLSKYRPSVQAIRSCMGYSIAETAISLFTFALFVNSAILIVAGAALYGTPGADEADLFGIHDLLSKQIAPAAGTIFALALLLSGISAGIVCTIAGQMVSEGQLNWTVKPWVRRTVTRSISITPSIIIAGAVGRQGLTAALEGSQVALSVILPFVSAPLIYFTCRSKYMTISAVNTRVGRAADPVANDVVTGAEAGVPGGETVNMKNNWITAAVAVVIWLIIVVMNVALLVLVGMGKTTA